MNCLQTALARIGGALIDWSGYRALLLHPGSCGLVFQPHGMQTILPTEANAIIGEAELLITLTLLQAMRDGALYESAVITALELGYPMEDAIRVARALDPASHPEDAA